MADGYRYPGGLTDADFNDGLTGTGYNPDNFSYGSKITVDVAGTVTGLSATGQSIGGAKNIKLALYDSSGNLVSGSSTSCTFQNIGGNVWRDSGAISVAVSSGNYYVMTSAEDTNAEYGFDNSGNGLGETIAYASFPPASISTTEDETGTRFGVRLYLVEGGAARKPGITLMGVG